MRTGIMLIPMLLACSAASAGGDDAASRLHGARSLRCTFTSVVATWVRSGHRTVEQTAEKSTVAYDNIDIANGTARMIANLGAGDVNVSIERTFGSLWLLERTPSGNVFVTTVFPVYAEGSDEFVVLEARHSMAGVTVLGEESYGTCKIVE